MMVSTLDTILLDPRVPAPVLDAVRDFLVLLASGPEDGTYELGAGARAILSRPVTVDPDTLPFETHRRVTDVHVVLSGWEAVHGASLADLAETGPYNEAEDYTLYAPVPGRSPALELRFVLGPRMLAVFGPGEAHKPRGTVGLPAAFRKAVLKVPSA